MGQSNQDKNIRKILSILKREYKNWDENMAMVKQMTKVHKFRPFRSLIMAIISTQTKDSVTTKVSEKLFKIANSPEEILKIPDNELENILKPASFYKRKAKYIKDTCRIIVEEYKNKIPSDFNKLIKLPGVGRKVANVFLSHVYKKNVIAVDTHVHRISNRLKWVNTKNPIQTEKELYKVVPKSLWRDINLYLVAFGQAICSYRPKCNICPILKLCPYEKKRL